MTTKEILHEKYNAKSEQFSPIRIKGFRRVDIYKLMNELGFKHGAEIGTAQGLNAVQICTEIPGVKLDCIDPYSNYRWKHSQDEHERCFNLAHERLDPFGANILRYPSTIAVHSFKDESLDFVYIDGNHEFDYVMEDLIMWGRKVSPGGIIAGHDYYEFRGAGIVLAVESYTRAHQINEWFICDFLLKENGKEPEYSFFFAKDG